jgi:GTP cyclohydrolase II
MKTAEPKLLALVERDQDHECAGFGRDKVCVRIVAVAQLPTRFGDFQIVAFLNNRDQKDHIAIVHGDVVGKPSVPTRLHSECLTGDVMGSLRCDCRDQLEASLQRIASEPYGVVLYMRQEGRGIGLANKVRAYSLQDRGMDTVEANEALGFRDDERDYAVAAHMIFSLGLESVKLMTNNPGKVGQLEQHGVKVAARIPHLLPPNPYNRFYLETKAKRSGHYIDLSGLPRLQEQSDPVRVEGMPEESE